MPVRTGFVSNTIDLQGESYRYSVFVPANYASDRFWPAVLYLHGMGERGDDGERHSHQGLGKAIREHPERFPCIVVMPQCRSDSRWEGATLYLALATLEAAMREYHIDPDRVALTGLSMGGFGAWTLGAQQTSRFSALVPICGGGDPVYAQNLAERLPIWCFHGDADPVVPVALSREMVQVVRAAAGNVKYTEFPGVRHNSWDPAYGDPEVITWMLSQRREENHPPRHNDEN